MSTALRAVAYARFSSDGQREESIDAQIRAIKNFAEKNGYTLHKIYADRGISGTTDKRPQFLRMIEDVKTNGTNAVIVHKLDRFARNRADSAIYRMELSRRNIRLLSVLENFDDSPESIILQSVIEGYNEYYSRNLQREVMKGLMENARTCRHTGGTPCLGYDVDKDTLKYVINPYEAEAVKLIFRMYLDGAGYGEIINELNRRGYKTKRGNAFGKNSLYEILRNEKYTGVYIYNKSVHPDMDGKFNRHLSKPDAEIVRCEGGIPQIISKEDFLLAQEKMLGRRKRTASFKAKQEYLLSGKIFCGECESTYAGNSRRPSGKNPLYVSYDCVKKNGKTKCKNTGIRKEIIEDLVLKYLADTVFDERMLPEILDRYNAFAVEKNKELDVQIRYIKGELSETEKGISNIVDAVVSTGSVALANKLNELEVRKSELETALTEIENELSDVTVDEKQLRAAFRKAKRLLMKGTLKNQKAIVEQYIKRVVMCREKIILEIGVSDDYVLKQEIPRPKKKER